MSVVFCRSADAQLQYMYTLHKVYFIKLAYSVCSLGPADTYV